MTGNKYAKRVSEIYRYPFQLIGKVCFFKNAGSLSLQECFVGFAATIAGKQNKQSVHLKARVIVRGKAVDVLFERVVGMERLVGVKQSLRLDGKKVCNIKMVGILQAESNNIKACALPSIHLPLTREASVMVLFEG